MKHIIFYLLITVFSMSLYAQETSLTINVSPGKLKEAMTEEQMKTVTTLTLTGEMDNSDFYFIRDNMKSLGKLDLSEVVADTIPVKAFRNTYISYFTLTKELKCIQDSAFSKMPWLHGVEFMGEFPTLGKDIFDESGQPQFTVGKDNTTCKIINNYVYSSDTTVLYLAPKKADEYVIDKTRRISSYAFDGCIFRYGNIYVPESVNFIGDYAFNNIQADWPVRSGNFSPMTITCFGSIPPVLGEEVFSNEELSSYTLNVPMESLELYKSSPQWGMFGTIEGYPQFPPQNIEKQNCYLLSATLTNQTLSLKATLIITSVELFSLEGKLLHRYHPLENICSLNLPGSYEYLVLRITYQFGQIECLKLKRNKP